MSRETQEPITDEEGWEAHPAFGNLTASRASGTPRALFDSEIRHTQTVIVRIAAAKRQRQLNRDWIHADRQFIEVEMSEAQWASFVSSPGSGAGASCTIRWRDEPVPDLPFRPRMEQSMDEVRTATQKGIEHVKKALDAVEEKPNKGNIRSLRAAVENLPSNLTFAAKSLTEHSENVVQKARADIEALVARHAETLGLEQEQVRALLPGAPDAESEEVET